MFKTEDSVAGFDFEYDANIDGSDAGILRENESMFNRIWEFTGDTHLCTYSVVYTSNSTVDLIQQQTPLYSSFVNMKNVLNNKGAPISE